MVEEIIRSELHIKEGFFTESRGPESTPKTEQHQTYYTQNEKREKDELLKASRENKKLKYKRNSIRITIDPPYKITKKRKEKNNILQY